jgi:folylpolyglutamate synthase/dihydropteroate synthase
MADAFRAVGVADVIDATDADAAVAIATARSEVSTVVVTGSFLHLNDVRRALLRRRTQIEGT